MSALLPLDRPPQDHVTPLALRARIALAERDGLVFDYFAGGGGASEGIKWARGRSPDAAKNHDPEAMALHEANHPETWHIIRNVWKGDPREEVAEASRRRCLQLGIPYRLLPVRGWWFSPDCKHHSKAKGSKPVEKGIRDLAWVAYHVAKLVKPDQVWLENVEEFKDWGPLVDDGTGRLVPCKVSKGRTFQRFVRRFRQLGYRVEYRELRASDYGVPTIRKRLFMIARRDGKPIVWPKPTHAKDGAGGLLPWRTAADDVIDWSIPCPSIFERDRPLVDNTLKRIALGIWRYVINSADPFIVPRYGERPGQTPRTSSVRAPLNVVTPDANVGSLVQPVLRPWHSLRCEATPRQGRPEGCPNHEAAAAAIPFLIDLTHHGDFRGQPPTEAVRTITGANRGEKALVSAVITKFRANSSGQRVDNALCTVTANSFIKRPGGAAPIGLVTAHLSAYYGEGNGGADRSAPVTEPTRVVPTENRHALVTALLAQHNYMEPGHDVRTPTSTVVSKVGPQALVSAHLLSLKGSDRRDRPVTTPVPALCAQGTHVAEVRAFLIKYYTTGTIGQTLKEPLHTASAKDHFALVYIHGEPYEIVDIGMRMLQPHELYRAQGFPSTYRINVIGPNGKPLTKTAQVRMCGNSVCPMLAYAIVRANLPANDNDAPEMREAA